MKRFTNEEIIQLRTKNIPNEELALLKEFVHKKTAPPPSSICLLPDDL